MQRSFSDLEYAAKKKLARRDRFLAEIDQVTYWGQLHKLIGPFYPKAACAGRPPIGLAPLYVAQQCFGLCDEGIEDAIYGTAGNVADVTQAHAAARRRDCCAGRCWLPWR